MSRHCFMIQEEMAPIPEKLNGRGPKIVVQRTAAIGDVLAASVVVDRLIERGYNPVYQTQPASHCILRRHPLLQNIGVADDEVPDINLDGAYERHPQRREKHFSQIFMERANQDMNRKHGVDLGKPYNCCPRLIIDPVEKASAEAAFDKYPKPWVFLCPFSKVWRNRTVPSYIWEQAAAKIKGTKFWLGYQSPAPPGIVDLQCVHLDNLVIWLSAADLLVTVDTGPMHIGAALGIPILALCQASSPERHLSDQRDYMTIYPTPRLACLNCQTNICQLPNKGDNPPCQQFNPDEIAYWANIKLDQIMTEKVSAIIPVYGSDPAVLKRCLECVLPQVAEVIITAETQDKLPAFEPHHKIRAVVKGIPRLGYGKNTNFGTRQSTGKYILHMNDDVFLDPGAVDLMRGQMTGNVGMVSARLMYPDGTVYFCGKRRGPGERGFGHINHRQTHWEIKEPCEQENMNMAACLMRRDAFYDSGCYDEDFFCYADDDAMCLQMRRAGWKLVLEPRASGIHLEGQSTGKVTGNRMELVQSANRTFHRKWGWYYDLNANRIPGVFE